MMDYRQLLFLLFAISGFEIYAQTGMHQISYYDDGQVKEEYAVLDTSTGIMHGKYIQRHQNGRVKEKGNYIFGKKASEWKTYYSNSKIRSLGDYENDKRVGIWNFYTKDGRLFEIFDADTWRNKRDVNYLISCLGRFNSFNYPIFAFEEKKSGKVDVGFRVDSNCNCCEFKAVRYTDSIFISNAIEGIKAWTKEWPKYVDVECQDTIVEIPVYFKLR
ncbi:MAG: hypothetical protein R6U85_04315 [Salinivirgaceae bacterium]